MKYRKKKDSTCQILKFQLWTKNTKKESGKVSFAPIDLFGSLHSGPQIFIATFLIFYIHYSNEKEKFQAFPLCHSFFPPWLLNFITQQMNTIYMSLPFSVFPSSTTSELKAEAQGGHQWRLFLALVSRVTTKRTFLRFRANGGNHFVQIPDLSRSWVKLEG